MSDATADLGFLRLSSDALPEGERLPMLCDFVGKKLLKIEFKPLGEGPVYYDVTLRALPGLNVWSSTSSPMLALRSRKFADGRTDDIVLNMGVAAASERSNEVTLDSDDAVMMLSEASPTSVRSGAARTVALGLPRKLLAAMVPNIEDAFLRPIAKDVEALRLLRGYLGVLGERDAIATPELRHLVAGHISDLVALTIGASRDAAAHAAGRGVRAARLRAIRAYIGANLSSPGLSVAAVASRHGISASYVHKLFESDGTTFSEFVLGRRLARAHRQLHDPRHRHASISAIAFDCGFSDLSYFNRTFRRYFGGSPSEIRAMARDRQ